MKISSLFLVLTVFLIACSFSGKNKNRDYLSIVLKIPVGADFIEVKKILGTLSLSEIKNEVYEHFISSSKVFEDSEKGISLRVNEARNKEVESIGWFSSPLKNKERQSASE